MTSAMLAAQKAAAAKKRDAEEAAKLVSDFAASHANPRAQSFVRGATLGGNVPVPADKKPGAAAAAAPVAAAGKAYNPLGPPSSGMGMFADASEVEPPVVKKPAAKKRNIDSFLAELKRCSGSWRVGRRPCVVDRVVVHARPCLYV